MANLGGSPNAAIAFDFLVGKGLSQEQAAGVVGNLQVESWVNPRSDAPDPTKTDPSARGRGIASWGPPRWRNLLTFAAGRDPWALDTQLDFLWSELPSQGLQELLATNTVEDATVVFQNRFENPKQGPTAHTDRRIAAAFAALTAYPAIRPPGTTPSWRKGLAATAIGGALVLFTYGAYKLFAVRDPEPDPEPWRP